MGSPVINMSFKEIEHFCRGASVRWYRFHSCISLQHRLAWSLVTILGSFADSPLSVCIVIIIIIIIILILLFFFLKEGCLDAEEALLEKMTVIQQPSEHTCRKPRCTRSKEKYLPEEIMWSTGKNNGHPLVLGFWGPKQKTEKYFGTCWQRPSILISDSVTGTLQ